MKTEWAYPSDWYKTNFKELFEFEGGLSISRADLSDEGVCYLHYGDIHKTSKSFVNVEEEYDSIPKYNVAIEEIKEKYLLKDGDIVFADASEDYEGIGKSIVVANPKEIPFISGLHTIVAKDKTDKLDDGYKRFFLEDRNIRRQLMIMATGISVYGISKTNIQKVKVVIPPKVEQQKIAEILSTWDKAIELKEKLIDEKKKLKKGLMQKLLTGEMRLPGFEGEWKEVKLEEVVKRIKGRVIKYSENGVYPAIDMEYITSGEFKNYTNDNSVMATKEDVLILWDGSRAGRAFTGVEGIVGSTFVKLICKDINNIFLKNHLELNETKIQRLREGSGIPHVPKDFLSYYKIKIPEKSEQEAIAKILLVIEKDIELMKENIEQYKKHKQGLMQLLLTGKVRVKV